MPNSRWIFPVLYLALIGIYFHKEVASYVIHQYIPLLAGFVIVAAGLAIYLIPKLQTRGLPDDIIFERRLELENKTRATLAQAIGIVILIISINMIWNTMNNTKQIANNIQATDRFNRAVDLFNHNIDKDPLKWCGGLYALERIIKNSPAFQAPAMDVLTGYARKHTSEVDVDPEKQMLKKDIKAILSVIDRMDVEDRKAVSINLSNMNIGFAYLQGINLNQTNLSGSNLYRAVLEEASLRDAKLRCIVLDDARLVKTDFTGADLSIADLHDADLYGAILRRASLKGANLSTTRLEGADLSNTDLSNANLSSSNLVNADLSGAILTGANLSGTDFSGAIGLTQKQLSSAITDITTNVPDPLHSRQFDPRENRPKGIHMNSPTKSIN